MTSPEYSSSLLSYIASQSFKQKDGLDAEGTTDFPSSEVPIQAELVTGKRESIYWEKVPPKVKQEALSLFKQEKPVVVQDDMLNTSKNHGKKRKRR